jgi:TolB protein
MSVDGASEAAKSSIAGSQRGYNHEIMRTKTRRSPVFGFRAWCGLALAVVAVAGDRSGTAAQPPTAGGEAAPVRITRDGLFKQRPAWSPDGKLLVFSRHRGDKIFVFLCKADGSDERRLTERADPEYDAVWSPDGKRLALALDKASPNQGDMEVYTVDLAGKDLRPVATTQGQLSHEESPAWSPDGKWIAYTSTRHGNQELYLARPDGKDEKRLTSDPATDAHPAWAPDGKHIAFATDRWGDLEIALLEVEAGKLTRLTTSRGLDDYPAWSPDGKRIAFTSNRDRNLEIYVMAPDGKGPTNATRHSGIDNFPAWTPDGRLTWVSNRRGGFDVYVLPAK